jgi:23S rRNA (cytosine1962-C5)-methyltransferase
MADRRAIFRDFADARIAHEDAALIVVDKPAGVPSQSSGGAADAYGDDDLVARVRGHLAARTGEPAAGVYLGVHQRLDRGTSGLIAYTRTREANKGFASQLEGRAIQKRYVAAVTNWPETKHKTTLKHHLAPGDDGRVVVSTARDKRAQEAVTQVRLLERAGRRALLELTLETGRTHQARVQLAAAGAPIAGDRLYGAARAEPERAAP